MISLLLWATVASLFFSLAWALVGLLYFVHWYAGTDKPVSSWKKFFAIALCGPAVWAIYFSMVWNAEDLF